MPTDRFFRLCDTKQNIIREAALKEFKRVPPEEVSINRIIQDAEISRGSFYTYFESKYDLLGWLIQDKVTEHQNYYRNSLEKNHGDIWQTMDTAFRVCVRFTMDSGFVDMIQNLMESKSFMYMFKQKMDASGEKGKPAFIKGYQMEIYEMTDKKKCPLTAEQFSDLIVLLMVILMTALKSVCHNKTALDEAEKVYWRQHRLLRYGACGLEKLQGI